MPFRGSCGCIRASKPPEAAVLRALIDVWPESMHQDDVAAAAKYSPTSGTFFGALSKLRKLELISGGKTALVASADLFD